MKIAGIIFAVVAAGSFIWAIRGLIRGWQEENQIDPTKMPTKDDMERADKPKKGRA